MFSDHLIYLIQEEREREVEAQLRVRRLLGNRRAVVRWHLRQPARARGEQRGR
jgi:hypothetical protein